MISSALPHAKVIVTLDFGLMVNPWKLHYFFEMRDKTMPVVKHNVPEVNNLVFDIAETTISMWGWRSKSGEVLEIFFEDTVFGDSVLA